MKKDDDQWSFGFALFVGVALVALTIFLSFTVLVEEFFRWVLRRPRKKAPRRREA